MFIDDMEEMQRALQESLKDKKNDEIKKPKVSF